MSDLTHFDKQGKAHMVDVSGKPPTVRVAVAQGRIVMQPDTLALIAQGLLTVVGRVKSPIASAKGRKLDLLQIKEGRLSAVKAWLSANGFVIPDEEQILPLT